MKKEKHLVYEKKKQKFYEVLPRFPEPINSQYESFSEVKLFEQVFNNALINIITNYFVLNIQRLAKFKFHQIED